MLKAENLTIVFDNGKLKKPIKAIDNMSLQVNKGEAFALIGPNGAGKSTTFNSFLGFIQPTSGSVSINNEKVFLGSNIFEKVVYLPEEPIYHNFLTIKQALEFYGSFYINRISNSKIEEVLEIVGLTEFKHLLLSKCSKGMRQKVGIASCLLNDPEIMLLDEPTRGLDPIIVKEFRDILQNINSKGTTIFLNSHMLSEIEMFCSNIAIIDKGKLLVQDKIENLIKTDLENYYIKIEKTEKIPDYIMIKEKTEKFIYGKLTNSKLYEFFEYTKNNNIKIFECSLKKVSLEDAFIKILKED